MHWAENQEIFTFVSARFYLSLWLEANCFTSLGLSSTISWWLSFFSTIKYYIGIYISVSVGLEKYKSCAPLLIFHRAKQGRNNESVMISLCWLLTSHVKSSGQWTRLGDSLITCLKPPPFSLSIFTENIFQDNFTGSWVYETG